MFDLSGPNLRILSYATVLVSIIYNTPVGFVLPVFKEEAEKRKGCRRATTRG